MSVKIMSQVFESSKTQGNARLVLLVIADACNDEGVCWPSISRLCRSANLSEPMMKKYLKAFEGIGLIRREVRSDKTGRQTSNLLEVNSEIIGKDDITTDILNGNIPESRKRKWEGVTGVSPSGGGNRGYRGEGVTGVSPSFMNHHNEPSVISDIPEETEILVNDKSNPSKAISEDLFSSQPETFNGKGPTPDQLLRRWNGMFCFKHVTRLSSSRCKELTKRNKDPFFVDNWYKAIAMIPTIPWMMGGIKDEFPNPISIDFFLREQSFDWIMEQGKEPEDRKPTPKKETIDDIRNKIHQGKFKTWLMNEIPSKLNDWNQFNCPESTIKEYLEQVPEPFK